MQRHYAELSQEDSCLWALDHELYGALEPAGRLLIVVARDAKREVCGYQMFILHRHPHYNLRSAYEDTVYLAPEHRRGWTGYKMLRYSIDLLKAHKVQRIYMHEKSHNPLSRLYLRLGAVCTDHVWMVKVGG